MTVLRSRVVGPEISMKTLESPPPPPPAPAPAPPEPSTPARSPFSFVSSFPSPEMETVLGLGFGSSRSVPPRRRSLRLASMSPAPASAVVSSRETSSKRKRITGASSAGEERKGGGGETRVLERTMATGYPVDTVPSMNSSAADGVEERYMRLRSSSRIAQSRVEVNSLDSNPVQENGDQTTGEMAQTVLDVDHAGKSNEEVVRFGIEEEENGVLVAEDDIMFTDKSKVESDGGSLVGEEVEELSRNRNGSVKRRRPGRPKGQKQLRVVADRSEAIDLSPRDEVFKPEERGCMEEDEEPDEGQEKDCPSPFPTGEEIINEEVEAGYMKLRSGFEIAKTRIEVNGSESDLVQKDGNQMVHEGRRYSYEEKGKAKLGVDVGCTEKASDDMALELGAVLGDREEENGRMAGGTGGKNYNSEEKGKGEFVGVDDFLSTMGAIGAEEVEGHSSDEDRLVEQKISGRPKVGQKGSRREAERKKAIELAPKFAFFKPEDDGAEGEEEEVEELEDLVPGTDHEDEDWPGPFSTAMKIIEERAARLRARELRFSSTKNKSTEVGIQWIPSKDKKCKTMGGLIPLLKDLCLKVLSDNAEEIESLEGIPDVIKHKLILMLCNSRKMSARILGLLMSGTPTEIHLSDCSWATEAEFEGIFIRCNTDSLKVLQLDLCGRCMPDYVVDAILARSPNSLPSLTTLSLRGAYRLSDDGLNAIVSSAPLLCSINLSQCSLITSSGITNLVEKLDSVLRELYIDDCQNVDAMLILPALKKLKYLELLSVAGIQSVCDKFVHRLIPICGSNMRELVFAGCQLNDSAIEHLANGCRLLQKLKLCRSAFSDEAVAAFLEASGGSLTELSLNSVEKVAEHTAVAISRKCYSNLQNLDLSFCRKMTDEALGLIVDNCSNLRILKLFGCNQVTDTFLDGHSNPLVTIIGLSGHILHQIEIPDFL
ncbi:uncharacterized protein [Elaeis guineensis]|uniref:Uncharacterized protein LOC105041840 isoform X2 n=1 Tax=Elaeis guineensis var. tenera TaxID=51953 RepID=A0A6I9QY16_ELAGV|nr:uncharacterized protein LOC105041840 isoform X2 [Elaeis guineensis]